MSATDRGTSATGEQARPGPRWLVLATLVAVAALVVGFAAFQLAKTGTSEQSLSSAYGFTIGTFTARAERDATPAPDLEGPALGGGRLALADYRGKVVLVNLWASWCGPCRREQPDLERVWREYKDRGVQFLGLNVRDQEAAALAYQDEFGVTYPSFFDPSSRFAHELRAQVLPTTYVIDREGRIAFRLVGTVDGALLREALDAILRGGEGGGA